MNTEINTKKTGDVSAAICLAMLVEAGYSVLLPWGDNQRYDLVAELNGIFYRIQCKSGRIYEGCVRFNVSNISTKDGEYVRHDYKGQVEYFLVWCSENRTMYCVPIEEVGTTSCMLRLEEASRQDSKIKWANDYIFKGFPLLAQR